MQVLTAGGKTTLEEAYREWAEGGEPLFVLRESVELHPRWRTGFAPAVAMLETSEPSARLYSGGCVPLRDISYCDLP
jgi:hypothetical protein